MDRTKTQHSTLNTEKKYCKLDFSDTNTNCHDTFLSQVSPRDAGRREDILPPRVAPPQTAGHLLQTPAARQPRGPYSFR